MENLIEHYFEKQSKEKKEICLKLRNLLLNTLPGIKEEYKWGAVVYDSGRFYIGVVRKGVNLGFAISGLSSDEKLLFKGSGKTMRHMKFESLNSINEEVVTDLLKLVWNKAVVLPY